jgi:predicted lysophospholipase L1 biosynthesis ABC-type transport system permease subunit
MRLVRVKAIDKILKIGGRVKKAQQLAEMLEKVRQAELLLARPVECRVPNCHCNRRG